LHNTLGFGLRRYRKTGIDLILLPFGQAIDGYF
jgi:hypothetical protein